MYTNYRGLPLYKAQKKVDKTFSCQNRNWSRCPQAKSLEILIAKKPLRSRCKFEILGRLGSGCGI